MYYYQGGGGDVDLSDAIIWRAGDTDVYRDDPWPDDGTILHLDVLHDGGQPLCDRGGGDGDVNVFTDPGGHGALHIDAGGHDGITQHDPNPGGQPLHNHRAARRDDVGGGGCRDAL